MNLKLKALVKVICLENPMLRKFLLEQTAKGGDRQVL